MMKKSGLILLIVLQIQIPGLFGAAPPLKQWQKCMGGSLQDVPGSMIHLNDGNTLLLSNVDSHDGDVTLNHGSTDIWLTKIDSSGNIMWRKTIGGSSIDIGTEVSELANGDLLISGYTASVNGDIPGNNGNFDALLIRTNSLGTIRWSRIYGGTRVDLSYSHTVTSDGGFVLGGGSYSNDVDLNNNHGDQDFWVLKTDSTGNILWQQSSGGSDVDVCYSITKDANGNIYACGTSNSTDGNFQNHGNYDILVTKYNPAGNILWEKTYGGSSYETAQTIIVDSHQKILVGGYTRSNDGDVDLNYGYGDSWILKLNSGGSIYQEKNFGGSGGDDLFSIIETLDGGYLLTSGSTSSNHDIVNSLGQEDIWLFKTDATLNTEWSRNYGGTGNDRPVKVLQNADGGFLVSGYTFSNDYDVSGYHGSGDIWLLKLSCKVPSAFFSSALDVCLGETITIADSSQYASQVSWFLNNSFISSSNITQIPLTVTGYYKIALNVQTCYYSSDYSSYINVRDCNLPVVNFSAQSTAVCANGQVVFNDASVGANSWQWQFPGGTPSTSTLRNPIINYSTPGIYSVMLTVTNLHGSQTAMKLNYIAVNALPAIPTISITGNELMSSASTTYQWFLNNTPVANEIYQSISATVPGFYQVMVTDNHRCSSISDPTFYSTTKTEEIDATKKLLVYPNPASSKLNVVVPENSTGRLCIINMKGQKQYEKDIVKGDSKININLLQYSSGIYKVLLIYESGKIIQQTLIINN
jgi:PKD repeat protein